MKILLDECVPKRFKRLITYWEVLTVQERGWSGIKNGDLLKKAIEQFDVFVTVDRNLSYQQNMDNLDIPILGNL